MGLIDKLKFNDASPLLLLNAPKDCISLFSDLKTTQSLTGKEFQQVMLFVQDKKALDAIYARIITKLADNAVFWAAYPKKTSGIESDLIRDAGWDVVVNSDYRIVSSVSIDDNWSGLRISKKKAAGHYKSSVPMAERKVPGIDYVKRTVTLPKDALLAMKPYKGLDDFFNSLAFSHKKEYVESIEDAKKPETRQRRIEKMIEMLQQLSVAKNKKTK